MTALKNHFSGIFKGFAKALSESLSVVPFNLFLLHNYLDGGVEWVG